MGHLLASILLIDGCVTAVWGRRFIAWQQRLAPDWYQMALDALLDCPEHWLRLVATGEALLGGLWLGQLLRRQRSQRDG